MRPREYRCGYHLHLGKAGNYQLPSRRRLKETADREQTLSSPWPDPIELNGATIELANNRDMSGMATANEVNRSLRTRKGRSLGGITFSTLLVPLMAVGFLTALIPMSAAADPVGAPAEIAALQAQVAALQTTVSTLQKSNADLQAQVAALQTTVSTLQNQLAASKTHSD